MHAIQNIASFLFIRKAIGEKSFSRVFDVVDFKFDVKMMQFQTEKAIWRQKLN